MRSSLQRQRALSDAGLHKAASVRAVTGSSCRAARVRCAADSSKKATVKERNTNQKDPGLGLKAVWVGAEQFGNLMGMFRGQNQANKQPRQLSKLSREEVLAEIKRDYEANYFVNGTGDMNAYEEDCLFTDPFSGFRGTQRFKKNVGNFGNFLEDVQLDVLDFREVEDGLCTRWRFGATLKFPWRPRLAAAGRTTHFFSQDTNRVREHREEWDTEVGRVLQQLLKPGKQNKKK